MTKLPLTDTISPISNYIKSLVASTSISTARTVKEMGIASPSYYAWISRGSSPTTKTLVQILPILAKLSGRAINVVIAEAERAANRSFSQEERTKMLGTNTGEPNRKIVPTESLGARVDEWDARISAIESAVSSVQVPREFTFVLESHLEASSSNQKELLSSLLYMALLGQHQNSSTLEQ